MTIATESGFAADESTGECLAKSGISVSGGVLCSYRASLASCGLWEAVQLNFSDRSGLSPGVLDELQPGDWLPLPRFVTLLDALAQRVEPELLKTLVRRRMVEPSGSNFYAPMLRSWSRSFGASPGQMLRGLLPLWRAALRHAEPPEVLLVAANEVHVLFAGPIARAVRSCEALSVSLEGVLLGLLDLASPRPLLSDVELQRAAGGVRAVCRF